MVHVEVLISLWLFLFAAQRKEFFLYGLKKLEQRSRVWSSMPSMGFEPMIPAFQQAKRVHALDSAATVIGIVKYPRN
jgi:hypothetical protein